MFLRRRVLLNGSKTFLLALRPDFFPEPAEQVLVFIHYAFLQRDDRVVGDGDVFGTNFRAALRDVAEADALCLLEIGQTVFGVERVHFQRGTLDVLRHGIELIGLKKPLLKAQFKPALAINPDILARYAAKSSTSRASGALFLAQRELH